MARRPSCTAAKVVDAVHKGGAVCFNCGAEALTIKSSGNKNLQ